MVDNKQLHADGGVAPITTGALIATNSVWSVVGDASPMVLAVVAIPIMIRKLGTAEFGILSMAWAIVGYTAVFDLGLSRALTKLVADKIALGRRSEIASLFWIGALLTLAFGLTGGVLLGLASPSLVRHVLNIPEQLQAHALTVFYILALTVPMVIVTSALQGFLAAFQRFDLITVVRIPTIATLFICPLAVLPFSGSLVLITALFLLTRAIACLATGILCVRVWPPIGSDLRMNRQDVKPLITFGGWVTVSNLIVPFMLYCDRFFVGAFLTISAVTYYATTYDVITKLTIIPSAIARAFFPAFAEALVANRARALQLLHRGTDLTFLAIAPIIVVAVTFAPEALHLWLGPAFAVKSGPVLRWLAIGVLVNSVGHLPYTLLQAANRPDITAKLHIVELPLYVGLVSCLIRWYGIEGAAIAWTVRLVFDTAGYWVAAILLLPETAEMARRAGAAMVAVLVVITMSVYLPAGLVAKTVFVSLALSLGGFCGWLYLLTAEEKEHVSRSITIVGAMVGRSI